MHVRQRYHGRVDKLMPVESWSVGQPCGAVCRERPFLFFGADYVRRLRARAQHPRTALHCQAMLQAAEADLEVALANASWVDPSLVTGGPSYVEMAVAHDGRERLIRLGLAYLVSGERRFALAGGRLIGAALGREWHTFLMADLVLAAWLHGLLAARDWLDGSGVLGAEDRAESLAAHIRTAAMQTAEWLAHDLIKGGNPLRRNHDAIEACTIGLIGLAYPEHHDAPQWVGQAIDTLDGLLATHVGPDGDWYEKTPRYQCYLLHWFVPFADACRAAGIRDYYQDSVVRRLFECLLPWMAPNGWNVGFNDVNHDELAKLAPWLLVKAASEYRDGAFLWALNRVRHSAPDVPFPDHQILLHFDPDRAPAPVEPPQTTVRHLRRSGVVLVRTGWGAQDSLFALQCGPYTSHDHLDKSTFELYYRGVPLVLDTGCGHYPDRGQYLPASMHNIVVVDGGYQLRQVHPLYGTMGFDFCPPFHGRIVRVLAGSEMACVTVDHAKHARVRSAQRTALFARPGYLIVLDELEDSAPHVYESYIHARGEAEVDGPNRRVRWTTPEGTEVMLHVVAPEVGPIELGEHLWAVQSAADMLIEYRAALWRRQNATLTYARVIAQGHEARFLQILIPRDSLEPPLAIQRLSVRGKEVIIIEGSDFRDVWLSQPSGESGNADGLVTDARVACVRVRESVPVAWLVLDGRILQWQGQPLVCSPIVTSFLGGLEHQ